MSETKDNKGVPQAPNPALWRPSVSYNLFELTWMLLSMPVRRYRARQSKRATAREVRGMRVYDGDPVALILDRHEAAMTGQAPKLPVRQGPAPQKPRRVK